MGTNRKRVARIESTYKLSKGEISTIIDNLPLLKKYQIENTVNPAIYGGIVITYDTKVIDVSLAHQLKKFRKTFYEIT